jgi:sugar/nucleoside kinase (ribokinase family)
VDKGTSRRTIIHKKGVVARPELLAGDIDLSGLRFILFDGFYFDTILRTAKRAADLGIVSVTDLSPRNRDPRIPEFLALIDYPILSELFLKPFCGSSDPVEAARSLFGGRNKAMLVTCGEAGVHIITGGGVEHVPAFKVDSIDTTGAGDVFHGAFLFALWKGYPLREATVFSSAVSAMKCTKLGGQSGIPSFSEVREFITTRMPSSAAWL